MRSARLRPPDAERPRIKKFRLGLAEVIPRFPHDAVSLKRLQEKKLSDLLIDYLNWRSRYVGVRRRSVSVEAAVQSDPLWTAHAAAIEAFLERVRCGDDLTLYLSTKPRTRGYDAGARPALDPWSDKDRVLNTMGFHHFHLDPAKERGGHTAGPNEVLFARVTRDTFTVIAIFGHKVFKPGSVEWHSLDAIHTQIALRHAPPGASVLKGNVVSSGHSLDVVAKYAVGYASCVSAWDPQIDEPEQVKTWFAQTGLAAPKVPKFEWIFCHLDLGFWEKTTKAAFWVQMGWN